MKLVFRSFVLATVFSASSPAAWQFVVPKPGWYSGDTHLHVQPCSTNGGYQRVFDLDTQGLAAIQNNLNLILADMVAYGLNVANVAIWAKGDETPNSPYTNAVVWDNLRGLIDGVLIAPQSDPANGIFLEYTLESSGLSVADRGHVLLLRPSTGGESDLRSVGDVSCIGAVPAGIPTGPCPVAGYGTVNDGSGDYPAGAIQYLRAMHPDALLGYAHMGWRPGYSDHSEHLPGEGTWRWQQLPEEFSIDNADVLCQVNPDPPYEPFEALIAPLQRGGTSSTAAPATLPIDVLFRRVDFLEAGDVDGPNSGIWWWDAYYKLLNAGQRPRLVAGTDQTCRGAADRPRTYVLLGDPSGTLTYDAWVDGVGAGRTSIADDPLYFLDLELGSTGQFAVGDQIDLAGSTIRVQATLLAEGSVDTTNDFVEIVRNGEVVACTDPGDLSFDDEIPVPESSWIAARQGNLRTHTAAAYVLVDNRPIAMCRDAEYWWIYMHILRARLADLDDCDPPGFSLGCGLLASECCTTVDQMTMDAEEAELVFKAIRDYAHQDVLPGVERLGYSTYADWGPVAMGIESYSSLQRKFFCFNAPPNTDGELRVSTTLAATPTDDNGATVFLGIIAQTIPVGSNDAGFVKTTAPVPPALFNRKLYYQYVWEGGGQGAQNWTASDVLSVPKQGSQQL